MNILSDTGHTSRFLTDWAGPEAMIKRLAIRLGVPVFPGHTLTYTGEVTSVVEEADEQVVEVALRAVDELGEHVSGTAVLTLPRTQVNVGLAAPSDKREGETTSTRSGAAGARVGPGAGGR
jgi:hypothetical protein